MEYLECVLPLGRILRICHKQRQAEAERLGLSLQLELLYLSVQE
jgi:hypothetical protein